MRICCELSDGGLVMKIYLSSFCAGILFATGLVLGGMTQPAKVTAFLDVFGDWDPALLFVMASAVAVYFIAYQLIRRRKKPVLAAKFEVSEKSKIDAPLLGGAVLFGTGWGLAGFCPGPAIVSLGTGSSGVFAFFLCMLMGIYVGLWVRKSKKRA